MKLFQNRISQTLVGVLAILAFSGDILDDVWDVAGCLVAGQVSHSSDHSKGNTAKSATGSHDDTAAIGSPLAALSPAPPSAVRYSDVDEAAPVGARPSIDHPPQLA